MAQLPQVSPPLHRVTGEDRVGRKKSLPKYKYEQIYIFQVYAYRLTLDSTVSGLTSETQ